MLLSTRNGAHTLPRLLQALAVVDIPKGGWHLVVVDNGSTDTTERILRQAQGALPLEIVTEPRPGKNVALNRGLAEARGDLLVLTDDDVIPSRGWLTSIRRAADERLEASVFGGPLLPEWELSPEDWHLTWVPHGPTYALQEAGEDGQIPMRAVFGGNMAVRWDVFERGHRFNESIGPQGVDYPMGSETEFLLRLEGLGYVARHVPDAIVRHVIRPHQMTMAWAFARAERFGRGQFRLEGDSSVTLFGVPRWVFREFPRLLLREAFSTIARNDRGRFDARWRRRFVIGWSREARSSNRQTD